MSYSIVCDVCGMELNIEKFDYSQEEFKGRVVKVQSFSCPKCDEVYIVAVFDKNSDELREQLRILNKEFDKLKSMKDGEAKDEKIRLLLKDRASRKRAMVNYNNRLRKSYIKELKRHGKR